jgi:hypothetical protein
MTFLSVHSATVGTLVSWLDKYPEVAEVRRLYAPQRSTGDIELLGQQTALERTEVSPPIRISRPPASHAASDPQGPHSTQGPRQLAPAQALPRRSQTVPSQGVPSDPSSSPLGRTKGPGWLVLKREVREPIGQGPRNQSTVTRIDDPQTTLDNTDPVRRNTQKVDERDAWKQKYLAQHA